MLAKLAAAGDNDGHRPQSTDSSSGYLTESNAPWERTQVLAMRYDRLVMYSSYMPRTPRSQVP